MRLRTRRSLVAVDPTARGIAFAFFSRGELLDWGHRRCGRDERAVIAFVEELVTSHDVRILLLEDVASDRSRRRPRIGRLLRKLAIKVRAMRVSVLEIPREDVRIRWAAKGLTTKEAVAAAIARELPELQPFVPPPRKTWMCESPAVNVFDAVSLVFHRFGAADPVR